MFDKIIAFFMSIIMAIMSFLGLGSKINTYEYRDFAYGPHTRNTLDLNIPKENDGEIGLVLFIHGGAWIAGDKDSYEKGVETAASQYGYAGASINYRYLSEEVDMFDILDDIDAALKCIKEKGQEHGVNINKVLLTGDSHGVNINKVLLTGDSAGAHLSLLYAYSRADKAPITPAAVVSNSGPTDLTDENFYKNNAMGDEEFVAQLFSYACSQKFTYAERAKAKLALAAVSPITYVNKNTVPTVINHGMKDSIVPYSNAVTLDGLLTLFGVTHYFNSYPNSDHDLGSDEANKDKANDLLFEYIATYLN